MYIYIYTLYLWCFGLVVLWHLYVYCVIYWFCAYVQAPLKHNLSVQTLTCNETNRFRPSINVMSVQTLSSHTWALESKGLFQNVCPDIEFPHLSLKGLIQIHVCPDIKFTHNLSKVLFKFTSLKGLIQSHLSSQRIFHTAVAGDLEDSLESGLSSATLSRQEDR